MVSVAVVLVTYESAEDLAACLGSLPAAAGPHELEVVVVDNASRDASAEIARRLGVKVLENPANLGLSRAIDIGAAATAAPWLLLVNPDTRLAPGSLARMLETAGADPTIGCVGPHLRNSDGSEYPTGRRFPSILVGALHGALGTVCMLVRREAYEAAGRFDAGYFMYFEEMDFCLRLAKAGRRVVYDPGAEVTHMLGGSTRSAPYRKVWNHHRSALRFYRRRYAGDPRLLLLPVVALFLLARGLVSLARTAIALRRA
jgi:N-acetylglucosaminyl-diphospho-decaprenol L-rhamnosyltransferase